jgi:signal transduction histidine kinase
LNLEKRVEEKTGALEQSQKKYLQLFNESPGYLTVQDKDFNIIEYNNRFKSDFSFSDKMTCYEVYKQRNRPCPGCPVEKTFKDGNTHTAEMDIVLKDGSRKNILIQTSAVKNSDGRTTHVLEMSTDITIIRTLQDHLVSLGLHISSISHGLKQLITGLDGGAYLIDSGLRKQDTSLISEGWTIVKDKITQTRQMVMNILFHSKERKLDRSDVKLKDLIEEAVSSSQLKLDQSDIKVDTSLPAGEMMLHIDKMAILAVLRSILENSVDACGQTGRPGVITIRAEHREARVILTLTDNGKGLSPDKKDKVFDLFYSDKGNKGTGLGLFIAKRSIEQHHGDIRIDSEPDKYTTFTITLPTGHDNQ